MRNRNHAIKCPACGADAGDPCHAKGDPFPFMESCPARKQEAARRAELRRAGLAFKRRHG